MDRRRWHYLTRQPGFIFRSVMLVLLLGVGTAWWVGQHSAYKKSLGNTEKWKYESDDDDADETYDDEEIDEKKLDLAALAKDWIHRVDPAMVADPSALPWLRALRTGSGYRKALAPADEVVWVEMLHHLLSKIAPLKPAKLREFTRCLLGEMNLPPERKELYDAATDVFWLEGPARLAALQKLEATASLNPPPAKIHELLGDCYVAQREFTKALDAYDLAASEPDAADAQRLAIHLCLTRKNIPRLEAMQRDARYAEAFANLPAHDQQSAALLLGNYPALLRIYLEDSLSSLAEAPVEAAFTLLCGIIWFLMLHQLGGVALRGSWRASLAVLLGALSPVITLFVIALQQHFLGFEENGEPLNDLIFYVSGVGLREELSKLLMFALLWWCLRGRSDAEVLVVAGCVGLGFAIEENINYFRSGSHGIVMGRFITANFLHVAMTGMCGLALTRWLRFPRSCWEQSLITILGMILLHGAYDFCLSASDPGGRLALSRFSFIMMIALAHFYLQELRRVRLERGNVLNPLWVFLMGVTVLFSCSLVATSRLYGMEFAMLTMVLTGISEAILIGMFAMRLRDL